MVLSRFPLPPSQGYGRPVVQCCLDCNDHHREQGSREGIEHGKTGSKQKTTTWLLFKPFLSFFQLFFRAGAWKRWVSGCSTIVSTKTAWNYGPRFLGSGHVPLIQVNLAKEALNVDERLSWQSKGYGLAAREEALKSQKKSKNMGTEQKEISHQRRRSSDGKMTKIHVGCNSRLVFSLLYN
jgi:hypothetical protein